MSKKETKKYYYTTIAFLFILVIVVGLISLGFWGAPKLKSFSLQDQDKRPEFIAGLIATGITSLGGLAFILNFLVAQERLAEDREQFKIQLNEEKARAAKVQGISEARLVSERFSKAINQLGDERIAIRVGGIYSLERIAKETVFDVELSSQEISNPIKLPDVGLRPSVMPKEGFEGFYEIIIETLIVFLREPPPVKEPSNEDKEIKKEHEDGRRIQLLFRADLQAALTVVIRLSSVSTPNDKKLNLIGASLAGANFYKANLPSVKFWGADLRSAYLKKSRFVGAWFREANLSRANFSDSDFSGSDFDRADLSRANLKNTNLTNSMLVGANLTEADLTESNLDGIKWNSRTQWSNTIGLHTARYIPRDLQEEPGFQAAFLLSKGIELAQNGSVKDALDLYEKAQKIRPQLEISAHSWNKLCWYGTLNGFAIDVLFAGDKAVELDPNNCNFRDSRAIARSVIGNLTGALEDLQFVLKNDPWKISDNFERTRRKYLEIIRNGVNPFTEDELNILKDAEA